MRPGAGLPETGDRAVNQTRIDRGQARIVQAVLGEVANLVVLEHDIAGCGQITDDLLAGGCRQVHRDRLLAAVGGQEVGRVFAVAAIGLFQEGRSPSAGVVACSRALDLDHFCAQVGEILAAPWAGKHTGQV
jgi:hypothetical protein